MSVVGAQQEEHDRHAEQELLGGCVLCPVIDLLPHVQIVICPCVELERRSPDVVEHYVRTEHVGDVGQRPRGLLGNPRDDIVDDFQDRDQDEVNSPRACKKKVMLAFGRHGGRPVRKARSSAGREYDDSRAKQTRALRTATDAPLALTQFALRLGRAD